MSLFTSQCFYVNIDVMLDVLIDIKTLACKNWHHLKSILKNWDLLPKTWFFYTAFKEQKIVTLYNLRVRICFVKWGVLSRKWGMKKAISIAKEKIGSMLDNVLIFIDIWENLAIF